MSGSEFWIYKSLYEKNNELYRNPTKKWRGVTFFNFDARLSFNKKLVSDKWEI